MKRRIKDNLKRALLKLHKAGERLGVHITPAHYYSALPNARELAGSRSEWARRSDLPGITIDVESQLQNLRKHCLPFKEEYMGNRSFLDGMRHSYGPGFGYIEAQALHSVIRHLKPRRMIEVGSGVSTYCMVKASDLNRIDGTNCDITCIEPHPSRPLREFRDINLITQRVQAVPVDRFLELERGDFLFIDSSHTVKPGSDVNFLILEVLPRLNPGVIVHFHDIYLPYDYQRGVLKTFFYWSETSLLRAFLINNPNVRIIFCLSQLHYDRTESLKEVFPEYNPKPDDDGLSLEDRLPFDSTGGHFPSSIYFEIL